MLPPATSVHMRGALIGCRDAFVTVPGPSAGPLPRLLRPLRARLPALRPRITTPQPRPSALSVTRLRPLRPARVGAARPDPTRPEAGCRARPDADCPATARGLPTRHSEWRISTASIADRDPPLDDRRPGSERGPVRPTRPSVACGPSPGPGGGPHAALGAGSAAFGPPAAGRREVEHPTNAVPRVARHRSHPWWRGRPAGGVTDRVAERPGAAIRLPGPGTRQPWYLPW